MKGSVNNTKRLTSSYALQNLTNGRIGLKYGNYSIFTTLANSWCNTKFPSLT